MTDEILTPGQVAKLYGVDPKTVSRWLAAGKLKGFQTPGGHWRIYASNVVLLQERGEGEPLAE